MNDLIEIKIKDRCPERRPVAIAEAAVKFQGRVTSGFLIKRGANGILSVTLPRKIKIVAESGGFYAHLVENIRSAIIGTYAEILKKKEANDGTVDGKRT